MRLSTWFWTVQSVLSRFEMQATKYGGEARAPADLQNRLNDTHSEIKRLESELAVVSAEPPAPPAPVTPSGPAVRMSLPSVRVFISSTMSDLQDERKAVEQALNSLDLQTVRAESVGAQSATPLEACLAMGQECDI